jgi:predicted transcriptional regulator
MSASAIDALASGIDEESQARLKRLAETRNRPSHILVREAIAQYLEREEKRDVFNQETSQAWEEFTDTGLHLTAEEADAWLAKLEQGDDLEPPECHV